MKTYKPKECREANEFWMPYYEFRQNFGDVVISSCDEPSSTQHLDSERKHNQYRVTPGLRHLRNTAVETSSFIGTSPAQNSVYGLSGNTGNVVGGGASSCCSGGGVGGGGVEGGGGGSSAGSCGITGGSTAIGGLSIEGGLGEMSVGGEEVRNTGAGHRGQLNSLWSAPMPESQSSSQRNLSYGEIVDSAATAQCQGNSSGEIGTPAKQPIEVAECGGHSKLNTVSAAETDYQNIMTLFAHDSWPEPTRKEAPLVGQGTPLVTRASLVPRAKDDLFLAQRASFVYR